MVRHVTSLTLNYENTAKNIFSHFQKRFVFIFLQQKLFVFILRLHIKEQGKQKYVF